MILMHTQIKPSSKAIIRSQNIPWIYEDRLDGKDVVNALEKMYNMTHEERHAMGKAGRAHLLQEYGEYGEKWEKFLLDLHERHGSWEDRRNYQNWRFTKV